MIRVAKPGLFTTVQDLGRYGYAHLGISQGGAADSLSFRIANLLVGNDENAPALEMTLLGASLEFEGAAIVALSGAACNGQVGGRPVPDHEAFEIPAGTTLECGAMMDGARCYLSVQGGFDCPLVLGSASTLFAAGFGGFQGRQLQAGDVLQIRQHEAGRVRSLRAGALDSLRAPRALRVTRGAQQDWFGAPTFATLFSAAYRVIHRSDRRGLRLEGAVLRPESDSQLLSEGVTLGAIQVPPDGQPIILFVDQQTTGGYPKIANVIAADQHRVGQLRPGDEVWFAEVSVSQAIAILAEQERRLKQIFV